MTAGSVGTNYATWPQSPPVTGVNFYKVWSGTDGKYEVHPFVGKREKWNIYSLDLHSRMVLSTKWSLRRRNGQVFVTDQQVAIPNAATVTLSSYPLTAAENNHVINKLLGKVKGHEFNLAVNLAQLNQTTDMLTGTLDKLGRAFLITKRGLKGDLKKALAVFGRRPRAGHVLWEARETSGRWLEIQYGWLPAVSDCFEAMKAFKEISDGPRKKLFKAHFKKPVEIVGGQDSNGVRFRLKGVRGRRLQFELYEEMSFSRQLGLLDPLSVAWELLPWSFVIDWFVPIGAYLETLNQLEGLKGRWLVTDYVRFKRQDLQWEFLPRKSGVEQSLDFVELQYAPHVVYNSVGLRRVLTPPVAQFPLPDFSLGAITPKRFLNAMALAYQRFGVR